MALVCSDLARDEHEGAMKLQNTSGYRATDATLRRRGLRDHRVFACERRGDRRDRLSALFVLLVRFAKQSLLEPA
jgi:hypothetical protein